MQRATEHKNKGIWRMARVSNAGASDALRPFFPQSRKFVACALQNAA
jgi:hypothetical protein